MIDISDKEKLYLCDFWKRKEDEDKDLYIYRVCDNKDLIGSWEDVADILNYHLNQDYTESAYRKQYQPTAKVIEKQWGKKISNLDSKVATDEYYKKMYQLKEQQILTSDARTAFNRGVRLDTREKDFYNIHLDRMKEFLDGKNDLAMKNVFSEKVLTNAKKGGILVLSDVHIGLKTKNRINVFDTDVAKERFETLASRIVEEIHHENIDVVYIINLGDLISNDIHTTLRLENRETVSEQLVVASELLSQMINQITQHAVVQYTSCFGNHDRIHQDKRESRNVDNFMFIIDEFVKLRLKDNDNFIYLDKEFDDGIVTLEVLGHKVCGVHGDKDKPNKIVSDLSLMLNQFYDLYLMGHRHSFAMHEEHGKYVIQNGSLSSTDEFALNIRKTSKPTQAFIVLSEDNPCEKVVPIVV